ncbi:ATP synthase subunit I [Rhodopila sp.]|uniref:N-ATPase subunit AtpR n=1 Tax=Rhodopila sp. TaxID=2480087 RepID=UPI002C8D1FFA|nr:ATP synthase subunit I [Rhodopila sp.]HVZ10003.1 ATP synthase subunit I [Rhodopila sp.]
MTAILDGIGMATAAHIALGIAAGVLVGLLHFATLRWATALYLGRHFALGLSLQLARLAVLGLVLSLLAHLGASALLAGALGLLAVRRPFLRRAGGWS